MAQYILEVCVDSFASAKAAFDGGAHRLELCSNLVIGGTSPSPCLFQRIKDNLDIKIHVLIRPRYGDFCYTDDEFQIIREEIRLFRKMGAHGVVFGILLPNGQLDLERMQILADEAGEMSKTLHRAFDVCADPGKALDEAIKIGMDSILTSGQANLCTQGASLLGELVEKSRGRIDIIAAGGVSQEVIKILHPMTKIASYHMSGKIVEDSSMIFRKEDVNMGLPGINEFQIWKTDVNKIEEAVQLLKEL